MVTKEILSQYQDLQKEIEDIRERIHKTEDKLSHLVEEGVVSDVVSGGLGGIEHFKVTGFPCPEYKRKELSLLRYKQQLSKTEEELLDMTNKIESFVNAIDDSHIRRIIRFRFIDGMTWRQVAINIGGGNNEGSVKMAFQRFMERKEKC